MENFDYITDNHTKELVKNAFKAVQKLDLIEFFRLNNPPKNHGFMCWNCPEIDKLVNELENDNHSGSSFAITCRILQQHIRNH